MKVHELKGASEIILYGRNSSLENGYVFFWTGSGMEFGTDSTNLSFEIQVPEEVLPSWICIYLNHSLLMRIQLKTGTHVVRIFSGQEKKNIKEIRVRKESPARFEDKDCFFIIKKIIMDGKFCEIDRPVQRIEVIGDSITSGEGLFGSQIEKKWKLCIYSSMPRYHYAEKVAEQLGADIRMVSQSGWGVFSSYDNNFTHTLPGIYSRVCGVIGEKHAKEYGASERYRFDDWNADIVIINLGTNDAAALEALAIEKKEQKLFFQTIHYRNSNSYRVRLKQVEEAIVKFLIVVRKNNPNATIIWGYGMLGNSLSETIQKSIQRFICEYNDCNIVYTLLQNTTIREMGAVGHPGGRSHMKAANIFLNKIRKMEL